jgi:hypothetical protein
MTQRFSDKWGQWLTITLLLGVAAFLAACGTSETPTPCPEVECPEVECPEPTVICPEPTVICPEPTIICPEPTIISENPYYEKLWASSAHNTADIDAAITCIACHNEAVTLMTSVTFPSGLEITGLGDDVRCMQCHQGRASTTSVDEAIAEAGLTDDDTVSEELGFVDIHYYAATATQMGTWAAGGYQYEGKLYDARFAHVEGFNTCTDCHDPHTLELKLEGCGVCHQGVDARDDFERIWAAEGSQGDYDGDGRAKEGIMRQIEGLQEILYEAIQAYAEEAGTPIVYDPYTSPYFFVDSNGNGEVDEGEAVPANQYNAWSGRLLKAAYNYHFSIQDPGAFIHGGKYVIQLLYDSIEDLDATLVEDLVRDDVGHFAGSEEAWRHWDTEGEVDRDCARCHSATGLPTYVMSGANYPEPVANGMLCATCHPIPTKSKRYVVDRVVFPSGVVLSLDSDDNLCMTCHQGRESSVAVEEMIEGLAPDAVSEDLRFPDSHYATGATLFGSEIQGAYQYNGRRYVGRNLHVLGFDTCVSCHGGHGLTPDEEQCATCHGQRASDERTKPQHHPSEMDCRDCHGMVKVENIRGHKDYIVPVDYDGDGDIREGHSQEVATIHEALYAAIQAYADDVVGTPIVYDARDPYFFTDINGNGEPDPNEVNDDNRYSTWTPRLVQAAYNYHYVAIDPGAYAHNGKYIVQILYDSLADIGGNTTGMIRP